MTPRLQHRLLHNVIGKRGIMRDQNRDPINGRGVLFDNATKLFLGGTAIGVVIRKRHVFPTPVGGTTSHIKWSQIGPLVPVASR